MAQKLTEIYQNAENDFLERRYHDALRGFATVAQAAPDHIWVRFRIGSILEQLKKPNRAVDIYQALAWHCIKGGYPLLGLVAIKRALGIQAAFEDALNALAELYGLESDRIRLGLELFPLPQLDPEATADLIDESEDKLDATATQIAQDVPDTTYPTELPPIPLFSLLTVESFFPILELLQLRTYAPGENVVSQGEPCSSIYMLAHGQIEVSEEHQGKAHSLARLTNGSVFGEMALISEAPRVASATALRESEVLELSCEDLELAAEDLDDITWVMAKFTRERFLQHLLLTSPVFKPFGDEEKREILERFTSVGVPTDEVIIKEGQPGPGLYMILGGEVEVSKFEGDSQVHLARLSEGSVFGEISLINASPTTATVRAVRGGEFLFLAREDFQDLIQQRPAIEEGLAELSLERLDEQRAAMQKAGLVSADGMVIF